MRRRPIDVRQRREDRLDALIAARARRCPRAAARAARCPRPGARAAAIAAPPASPSRQRPAPLRPPPANGSPASGSRSSRRQRERMVGSSRLGSDEISRNSARCGGSSSDFSSALAALMLSSSALSTITTRQAFSAGSQAQERFEPAHLVDRGCWPRSAWRAVVGPAQHQQARMRQRAHLPRRRGLRADLEAVARRIALLGSRQHVPRQPVGQRRLADALASGDQPGVVHAPAGEGLGQLPLGRAHGR